MRRDRRARSLDVGRSGAGRPRAWVRAVGGCATLAIALSLVPSATPPAAAAGLLVLPRGPVVAAAGQTFRLTDLVQPLQNDILSFTIVLTGGLTLVGGGQTSQGAAYPFGLSVIAASSGTATVRVTGLRGGTPITDEATTEVNVAFSSVGAAEVSTGKVLPLRAVFPLVPGSPGVGVRAWLRTTGAVFLTGDTQSVELVGGLEAILEEKLTAKGAGTVSISVASPMQITQEAAATARATATIQVVAPVVTAPAPGQVRFVTTVGTASAKAGQELQLGSLFKAVEVGKEFNFTRVGVSVVMTGGIVLTANGSQSTGLSGEGALENALLVKLRANSSGTVTVKVTGTTPNFVITDEATVTVEVPQPATVPATTAPGPTAAPAPPGPTAAPAPPGPSPAPAPPGNGALAAVDSSVVAKANTATSITLRGTAPAGRPLSYAVVELPEHGRLTGQAPNLRYTPDKGFAGTDAFTFTVSDGTSTSAAAVIAITVTSASKAVAPKTTKKPTKKTTKKAPKKTTRNK